MVVKFHGSLEAPEAPPRANTIAKQQLFQGHNNCLLLRILDEVCHILVKLWTSLQHFSKGSNGSNCGIDGPTKCVLLESNHPSWMPYIIKNHSKAGSSSQEWNSMSYFRKRQPKWSIFRVGPIHPIFVNIPWRSHFHLKDHPCRWLTYKPGVHKLPGLVN